MAVTPNYGFNTPDDTSFVKDGASAIRTLGNNVDSTLFTALGGAYPGLRLIKKQTIGSAVASVNVTAAFTATYDAYKIIITGGVGSANGNMSLRLGATATGYYLGAADVNYATSVVTGAAVNNGASFSFAGYHSTNALVLNCDLVNPFLTTRTIINASRGTVLSSSGSFSANGFVDNATSYSDFTLATSSGTLTGGTIYVYGYGIS